MFCTVKVSSKIFDKTISTTLRELTVARVCFCEMMAIKIRRSQNLFWGMQCPNKLLRSFLLQMKDYYVLRILSIRCLEY